MDLVNDDEVPRPGREPVAQAHGQVHAHDDPIGVGVELGAGHAQLEGLAELLPQLVSPLLAQGSGGEHEDAAGEAAQHQFLDDEPGFDRLAQAHLVGQHGAAAELAEHLAGGALLVGHVVDGGEVDGERLVEAVGGGQPPPCRGGAGTDRGGPNHQR
ncbi:MAG: hypothetical protein R2755_23615 [Acidimicrobiales bacterium]